MSSRRILSFLCMALVALLGLSPAKPGTAQLPPQKPEEIVLREALVIPSVGRYGRNALHTDAIEHQIVTGTWKMPQAGDTVMLPDGAKRVWQALKAKEDGTFESSALEGGYAALTVTADTAKVMLLEASAHSMVYVNGEPRGGDVYETGKTRLPVLLRAGTNTFLFQCARGHLRAKLVAPKAPARIDLSDPTLPDLILGEKEPVWGATVVINATTEPLTNASLRVSRVNTSPLVTPLPTIPPLSARKVGFRLKSSPPGATNTCECELTLLHKGRTLDTARLRLDARHTRDLHKRTFLSRIDGSVQYYAVNPAQPLPGDTAPPALVLTLHGAGVEASGQAAAYLAKTWAHLVAPTNRRPYGFDWEDWGRLDAMEVLDLATQRLHPDPRRIYLTGHSMGGHGTWHVGVTFPDRFAAIGPSAGWISFTSYAGASQASNPTPMQAMLQRAALPSDTLALSKNYAQEGVYILHGGADDNVPVEQARAMSKQLAAFHHDFIYFEQPGAGHWWGNSDEPGTACVDWPAMFDFFSRRQRPPDESVRQVDFTTASPGVSAWSHWAGIEAQIHAFQLSSVRMRYDPGLRRFVGTTENVARLTLDLHHVRPGEPVNVELDGVKLAKIPWPAGKTRLWLARGDNTWTLTPEPLPALKNPRRSGPFKDAFRNRMLFVYGTKGTPEQNAWAFAKARYDAETFWYRGNGSVDIMADTAFDAKKEMDRNVILYGNAETNAAWNALLADSPVQVRQGRVKVGEREVGGEDLACLFLRPRPGSETACVGVVTGSGLVGMRLTDRIPVFLSGAAYPDCLVLGADSLTNGSAGVRCAGFFGNDWGVLSGEFVWQ